MFLCYSNCYCSVILLRLFHEITEVNVEIQGIPEA